MLHGGLLLLLLEMFEEVRKVEDTDLAFTFLEVKVTPGETSKYFIHRFFLHIAPVIAGII